MNSEAKPLQILLGTPTREPAQMIHPSLGNLDRLLYLMSRFKSCTKTTSLEDLLSIQDDLGMNFLHKCDLTEGIIVIQFPAMKNILQMNNMYALQTDTLEGWIQSESEQLKWNVNVTSVHSDALNQHVPTLVSLTRTRTGNDYKGHFDHIFRCMEYQSFDQFLEKFPGNISDFSAAAQGGFRMSLIDWASNIGYEK
jgi:hypothetical protein